MNRRLPFVASLWLAACSYSVDVGDPGEQRSAGGSPPAGPAALDLLFVVDNSASMGEEQASLAANFPAMMAELESLPGGLPSLHVGVVSTDLGAGPYLIANCVQAGDGGSLRDTPTSADCTGPSDAFIADVIDPACSDADPSCRIRNFSGTLGDTFSCIAQLGIDGCGFEQPLEAMRRALNGSLAHNDGFLRPDAKLGIIFITDEDDCSATTDTIFDTSQNGIDDPLGPLSSFRCTEFGLTCDGADTRQPHHRVDLRARPDRRHRHRLRRPAQLHDRRDRRQSR